MTYRLVAASAALALAALAGCTSAAEPNDRAVAGDGPIDGVDGTALEGTEFAPPGEATPTPAPPVPFGSGQEIDDSVTVTIVATECGRTTVSGGLRNPEYSDFDEDDPDPPYLDAEAGGGYQWCRVEATYEVTGDEPIDALPTFDLRAEDGKTFTDDGLAEDVRETVNTQEGWCIPGFFCDEPLNPETKVTAYSFFRIPDDKVPQYAVLAEDIGEGVFLLELGPIGMTPGTG